jgi:aryl-alcohol dehydrogenase-like predicted oxidoreductase
MERCVLGKTQLEVSRLGVGLSELGYSLSLEETRRAAQLLNRALDCGINFLDTAACYGNSEELIGKSIAHRRSEFVLSTKAGHAIDETSKRDWTNETISESIERSLKRMQTDYLDIVHLHSCGLDVLMRGEVIQALQDARQAGKTRFIGYSGDNEAAIWAVDSGLFDTIQTSFNLVDQWARFDLFPKAKEKGLGIIAKRPIANMAWGTTTPPSFYAGIYHQRAQLMAKTGPFPGAPDDNLLLALGFILAHKAVDVAIVGTSNPDHLESNIRIAEEALPIDKEVIHELHERFEVAGVDWRQQG